MNLSYCLWSNFQHLSMIKSFELLCAISTSLSLFNFDSRHNWSFSVAMDKVLCSNPYKEFTETCEFLSVQSNGSCSPIYSGSGITYDTMKLPTSKLLQTFRVNWTKYPEFFFGLGFFNVACYFACTLLVRCLLSWKLLFRDGVLHCYNW